MPKKSKFRGYRVDEDLKYLIEDLKEHRVYMKSISSGFSRRSVKRKKSKAGQQLLTNIEESARNLREVPRGFVPKPIAVMYQQAATNSLAVIESTPIADKWQKEKTRVSKIKAGTTFRGFSFKDKPNYFMTGRFHFLITESFKKIGAQSQKVVSPKGIFIVGVRTQDFSGNISPYGKVIKNKEVDQYFNLIGAKLQKKGVITPPRQRPEDDDGEGEGSPADSVFFGLTKMDARRIAIKTRMYLQRYYKLSATSQVKISPRQVN